jgi:hypothetical protein
MPDFFDYWSEQEAAATSKGGRSGANGTNLLATPEGGRNHRLNEAAFNMGQLVGGAQIDEASVRQTLEAAGRGAGLDEREVSATVSSGLKAGMESPRAPLPQPGRTGLALVPGGGAGVQGQGHGASGSGTGASPGGGSGTGSRGDDGLEYAEDDEPASQPVSDTPADAVDTPDPWAPVDLGPILDGTYVAPQPTLMPRPDGHCLLYPGLVHSFYGESESGKSWVAQAELARLICGSQKVLMVDFESDPGQVVGRLLAMGTPRELLAQHFEYRQPSSPPTKGTMLGGLLTSSYTLVVIDGVTEALGVFGLKTREEDDIVRFMSYMKAISRYTGAAVVLIDHVTKSSEDRGRFAIGSQHKLNAVDGAAYGVEVEAPLGVGMRGELVLRVTKDRPGQVRGHAGQWRASDRTQEAARFFLDSTRNDGYVGTFLENPITEDENRARVQHRAEAHTREMMQKVADYINDNPGCGSRELQFAIVGRQGGSQGQAVTAAAARLVVEGYAIIQVGRGNVKAHRLIRPYVAPADQTPDAAVYDEDDSRGDGQDDVG